MVKFEKYLWSRARAAAGDLCCSTLVTHDGLSSTMENQNDSRGPFPLSIRDQRAQLLVIASVHLSGAVGHFKKHSRPPVNQNIIYLLWVFTTVCGNKMVLEKWESETSWKCSNCVCVCDWVMKMTHNWHVWLIKAWTSRTNGPNGGFVT